MNNSGAEFPSSKDEHERLEKLVGAYTAFISVLLLAMFAKSNEYPSARIVISLLAFSLPSLVAFSLLDFIVRIIQGRRKSMFRGLAFGLGFVPSISAVAIVIGHFSVVAAALFLMIIVFWLLVIFGIGVAGSNVKPDI